VYGDWRVFLLHIDTKPLWYELLQIEQIEQLPMRLTAGVLFGALAAFAGSTNIPDVEISPGVHLPLVGLGTWEYNSTRAGAAVALALELGYTHIDTAWTYHNSKGIGVALKASKRPRSSYFITSKVDGDNNASRTLYEAEEDLQNLGLAYVDLLLLHWPASSKAKRQEQWRVLERFHREGKARAIGVSHYCERHITDILEIATVKPAINQVQYHVGMGSAGINATDMSFTFGRQHNITYQSFSPLCGPCGTDELLSGELVTTIGKRHNKTGAQVRTAP
jgi:diketogulonate reductase-like aldo/keto reductase